MDALHDFLRRLLFLPEQASSVAREIDALHYVVITITMLGTLVITAVAAVFCMRYRSRRSYRPDVEPPPGPRPAPRPPLWAELGLIAGLFGLFVAFWGVGFWQFVRLAEPPAETYDIYVSGKQWMWKFAYPTGQHSINQLYVPEDRPVRLLLTSRDVIHSFFVPDFRIKHDAVPGRFTQVWFTASKPGSHRIFCTEYCGTDHSGMIGEVVVLSGDDFARWLDQSNGGGGFADPELLGEVDPDQSSIGRGQSVAARHGCLRCHTLDGSPHIGPSFAGLYGASVPLETGGTVVADVAYLTESMMDPLAKLHRGYQGVMPSYLGYLQSAEVGALVELIKSLEGGGGPAVAAPVAANTGVFVLPSGQATGAPQPAGGAERMARPTDGARPPASAEPSASPAPLVPADAIPTTAPAAPVTPQPVETSP
jgi:cytochrome c oxidase subunit II